MWPHFCSPLRGPRDGGGYVATLISAHFREPEKGSSSQIIAPHHADREMTGIM